MIAAIRDAAWLTPARARLYGAAAGCLCLLLGYFLASVVLGLGSRLAGNIDFVSFYAAARLALADNAAAAWDPSAHAAARVAALGPGASTFPFLHPPPFLVLLLPFGLLPYWPAMLAWLCVTLAALLGAMWRWVPWPSAMAAVILSPASIVNAAHGQTGYLMAAALAACGLFLTQRPALAGIAVAVLSLKPQLGLLVLPSFLAARRWRAIAWSAVFVALFAVASGVILGWDSWRAFLASGVRYQALLRAGALDTWKVHSVAAFATTLGLGTTAALLVQLSVSIAVIGATVFALRHRPGGMAEAALIGAGAPLITPYFLVYDLAIQLVPIAWILDQGRRSAFLSWEKSSLVLVAAMPAIWLGTGMQAGLSLTAPVSALLFVLAIRRVLSGPRLAP